VLVECGFLTNPTEARLALQSSYRDGLADRITDGIMGKPTPSNRPVVAGLTRVPAPIRQPFNYNDFVRAEPERSRSSHRTHSSAKKKSSRKKSTSSSTKKKSSTTSSTKKSSSSDSTKKKKKPSEEEPNE
jgi:N-acetylmuramoyl-L-alanine amidase